MVSTHKLDSTTLAQLHELLGERFAELVERFLSDGSKRIAALKGAVEAGDFVSIYAEAHGFKGSSRNIGANDLAQVCELLEEKGRQRDAYGINELFVAVEQEFASVCEQLRAY